MTEAHALLFRLSEVCLLLAVEEHILPRLLDQACNSQRAHLLSPLPSCPVLFRPGRSILAVEEHVKFHLPIENNVRLILRTTVPFGIS